MAKIKDSLKFLQEETERISAFARTKKQPFTDDDGRKIVDLVQAMAKTARLVSELENAWGKDLTSFVFTYFDKVKKEKV